MSGIRLKRKSSRDSQEMRGGKLRSKMDMKRKEK